jgi:hypothetical protein
MIDREATEQENKRPLTFASLRQTAIIEDVDLRVREASRARRSSTAIGSPQTKSAHQRTDGRRQELDRLRAPPQGVP